MALIRVSTTVVEPLLLEEMKEHLKVDYDDEDTLIASCITAARQKLERRCGRCFIEQTWEMRTSEFEDLTELPMRPTASISSVTYLNLDHASQTVDPADYALVDGGEFDASSVIWIGDKPTELADRPDAARIQFVSGWPVDEVPEEIKQAIRLTAAHFYANREQVMLQPTRQEIAELPDGAQALIAPYIIPRL